MIWPVAQNGFVVFHSSLDDEQGELIDRLQNQALKYIYGPFLSGRKMRQMANIPMLRARRIEL